MKGLSVIICSIKLKVFEDFESSLKLTIGISDYEVIRVDNNKLKLPLTQAYNYGASRAKYNSLLFIHEDVVFHTDNWGSMLLGELNDEKIGVIGVAGSSYVPFVPCGYTNPVKKYNFCNIIQCRKKGKDVIKILPEDLTSIKALDGVFLATKKSTWEQFKFNEKLPGFHAYDLDFSLRVSKTFKNKITKNILIEHLSEGNIDELYLRSVIKVKKWTIIENVHNDTYNEYSAYRGFIGNMSRFNFSKKEKIKNGAYFLSLKRLGIINYFKSIVFLSLSFLKKTN